MNRLPTSWLECEQLEIEARAKSKPSMIRRRKIDVSSHPANPAALQEGHVRLCWGYLLRQLEQVAAEHAQWHLHDTSASGITGHSGKVDYCFTADKQKAWAQMLTLAGLKKDLQLHSLYTECIGQLKSRSDDIRSASPQISGCNCWRCRPFGGPYVLQKPRHIAQWPATFVTQARF